MSEAPGTQGQPGLTRPRLYFHPPYPYLSLQRDTGVLLILPRSAIPHALERFQINPHGLMRMGEGTQQLAMLTPADWEAVWAIRDFYNASQHDGASRLQDPQIIAWLQRQVQDGWLAAFWFPDAWNLGQMVMNPAALAPVPAPATQTVAQWSLRHKIIAMFEAVPAHLGGAARAQFLAFITPENLTLMAGFFALVVAVQAVPGADAAVDLILTGLAWAMYGWAGLVATRDLIEAVIKAARAQRQADIDQAAQLAASALVVLGVTLFLKKLADRVSVENAAGPKPASEPTSAPVSSPAPRPRANPTTSWQEETQATNIDSSTFIYRGDSRPPDVIFNQGFQPKGTATDLYNYAATNTPSNFISTSKIPGPGINFAQSAATNSGEGYLYIISQQPNGIDVNEALGAASPFPDEAEIAVPGGIPPQDVLGAQQISPDGSNIGGFIPNPGFKAP
ncbi:MAG: hypothetical protein KGH70_02470 [Rhodospirillales bacterium]|nr:hypothetical protein [Rhodospirillales bacterium]